MPSKPAWCPDCFCSDGQHWPNCPGERVPDDLDEEEETETQGEMQDEPAT